MSSTATLTQSRYKIPASDVTYITNMIHHDSLVPSLWAVSLLERPAGYEKLSSGCGGLTIAVYELPSMGVILQM